MSGYTMKYIFGKQYIWIRSDKWTVTQAFNTWCETEGFYDGLSDFSDNHRESVLKNFK